MLFQMVLDKEIIQYEHIIVNDNALWWFLLSLNDEEYNGGINKLIIRILSNNAELILANNSNEQSSWQILSTKLNKVKELTKLVFLECFLNH